MLHLESMCTTGCAQRMCASDKLRMFFKRTDKLSVLLNHTSMVELRRVSLSQFLIRKVNGNRLCKIFNNIFINLSSANFLVVSSFSFKLGNKKNWISSEANQLQILLYEDVSLSEISLTWPSIRLLSSLVIPSLVIQWFLYLLEK